MSRDSMGYLQSIVIYMILGMGSSLMSGCGVGGEGGAVDTATVSWIYYVDAINGDDMTGNGSLSSPFQTISKAVFENTQPNSVIIISPGTYNASLGEIFPIVLDGGVSLVGVGATADQVVIDGSGSYMSSAMQMYEVAVVINGSNKIENLAITASQQTGLIVDNAQNGSRISNTRLVGSGTGIVFESSTNSGIDGSDVEDNVNGILIQNGSSSVLRGNQIRNNTVGTYIDVMSEADIGTQESNGRNTMELNSQCDLLSESNVDISALGNLWDANEFSFNVTGICTGGANIVAMGMGTVLHQFVPTSTSPIFPGTTLITSNSLMFGELIATDSPTMVWGPTGQSLVLAAIFDHPVIVSGRSITNAFNIVWLWHSGLENANEGDVPFGKGVAIANGKISNTLAPQPLEPGRTYYWIVMAWDITGTTVSHTSYHNYFITAP